MTAVSNLIDQVSAHLHSFTGTIEPTTYLTSAISGSTENIPVAHPTRITQGLIEVDDELIHVSTVGASSASAFPGFGRGAQLSSASSHAENARVTNDPMFPRVQIYEALKRAVSQVQPDLFKVDTTEITSGAVQTTYEIPADVTRVLKVQYLVIGGSEEWLTIKGWHLDHNAATPSGKAIVLTTCIRPGSTVQITYAAPFTAPASTDDDLESDCSIPFSMHDVLLYNAAWQLIQFMEPYRLQLRSVEQQARAQGVEVGGASKVAQQLYAMYQTRKSEERGRLLTTYPPAKHYAVR